MTVRETVDPLIQEIFKTKGKNRGELISILQKIQENIGFLSKENMILVANYLNLSFNEVYGVASFYKQFKFIKPGKHIITVCLGTACFVRGGSILAEAIKTSLGINPDETTKDGLFTFERVACLGCCALAPVVQIDGDIFGEMTPAKLLRQIKKLRKEVDKE